MKKDLTQKDTVKIVAAIAVYAFVLRPLTNAFGITKSNAQKVIDNAATNEKALDPNFYNKSNPPLTRQEAFAAAYTIFHAMGYVYDDEDKIIGVFRKFQSKSQVSQVAAIFLEDYGIDMYTYLKNGKDLSPQNGMSEADLTTILNIVKGLPDK